MTIKISHWVIFMGAAVSVWLTVSLPQYWRLPQSFGRPLAGQPALVASDQAASRLAPPGFDQAQGRRQ
jgi:hypothetical protein